MQNVSKAYKEAMKSLSRNRGYIRATIGVINSKAQKNIKISDSSNLTYYSDKKQLFEGHTVDQIYATAEQGFSRVDGSMYFLPKDHDFIFYNNGAVSDELLGAIYIDFTGNEVYDIKGFMIDFGDCYPVNFTIENDEGAHTYFGNDKRYWTTEDVFNNTSFLIIKPSKMVNGQGRLRIYQFSCGIVNTFTNTEVTNYSSKEYVSAITDTIPSSDVSLTVVNYDQYYNPDNPNSTLAFMELGQEVKISFGYDVLGDGNIEWLPEKTSYLQSWSANDAEATFASVDRFEYMSGTYYKGVYREEGICLYDLAVDVLKDAGITDAGEYYIDPYLKKVVVYNPMPPVRHPEALQIIANAGRCSLSEDRNGRIHIQSSFVPDAVAFSDNQTAYSKVENILSDEENAFYAVSSNDFSVVDGTLFFMPQNEEYLHTGYISNSIADADGNFKTIPKITIELEASYIPYGINIEFRNVAPQEFRIITYNNDVLVNDVLVSDSELLYQNTEQFELFDKMELVFTKGYPNSRIFVDKVIFGDTTDYLIPRNRLTSTPNATRQNKLRSIEVTRNIYKKSGELRELASEEIEIVADSYEYTVYFSNPSYGLAVTVTEDSSVFAEIIEKSSFYAKLKFTGIKEKKYVKYTVTGYEFVIDSLKYFMEHNKNGEDKTWNNPLISTESHAADVEEWLASYFLGDVEYEISWNGDPRCDANDLFHYELKSGEVVNIRGYENTLNFSSGWSGILKARKVTMKNQTSIPNRKFKMPRRVPFRLGTSGDLKI
ncbi:MAG: hypothetical protein HDQ97_00085 [Lachnospiraceae bacterium]|nr:hypothetical protein [Lachnospiraceae bacterium]